MPEPVYWIVSGVSGERWTAGCCSHVNPLRMRPGGDHDQLKNRETEFYTHTHDPHRPPDLCGLSRPQIGERVMLHNPANV